MTYCCGCGYYFGESNTKPKACPDCFRVDEYDKNVWKVNENIPDGLFIKVVVFLTSYMDMKDLYKFVVNSVRLSTNKNLEEL